MSERIERLSANDFEEAIDFLNLVFSQASRPHDFVRALPKLYRPTDEDMRNNFAIRKNGRIRAIVGLFPMTAYAGGKTLKVAGIGGVSTHPNERGSGLMKQLMEAAIQEMHSEGFHLSCLGGRRQRYGYYGYEKAGTECRYQVTKDNIRHCFPQSMGIALNFKQLEPVDREYLSRAKELYDAEPFHCSRPIDEFYLFLKSWEMDPWAAFDKNGRMVGYLVANKDKNAINEILAESPDTLLEMTAAWMQQQADSSISILLPPWAREAAWKLGWISEGVSLQQSYNWLILNWAEVIDALLAVKSQLSGLADGEAVMEIKNYGVIRISVKDGAPSCRKVDEAADITCDSLTAMRLMLGPAAPEYITAVPRKLAPLFSSWFPVPLCWLPQDGI